MVAGTITDVIATMDEEDRSGFSQQQLSSGTIVQFTYQAIPQPGRPKKDILLSISIVAK